jgi:hypothetical protein
VEKTRNTGRSGFTLLEFPGTASAAGKKAEHRQKAQGTYFARWEGFVERWSKHRLQDLQSTIELAARPWCAVDPRELAEMQRKWMAGIVDRCVLDTLAFAENAFSLPLGGVAPSASPRPLAKRHESEVT